MTENPKPFAHPPATVGRDVHYYEKDPAKGAAPIAAKVTSVGDTKSIERARVIYKNPDIAEVVTLVLFHPDWHHPGNLKGPIALSPDGKPRAGYWVWPPRVG